MMAAQTIVLGTGTTSSTGTVTFTVPLPTKYAQFELWFAGDSHYLRSHSNVVLVKK